LSACVAEGTDYSALPFVRVDRTTPQVTRVDVPMALLTVDTFPSEVSEDTVKGEHGAADRGELAPSRVGARDYSVRFPWPFGLWQRRGGHRSWTLTSMLLAEGQGSPGPLGRGLSSEAEVAKNPFPGFASDPTEGGFAGIPFLFSDVQVDHEDHPGREGRRDVDHDISLWPFFAFGRGDKDESDYFALMPFGGRTRGLLGKEQIDWIGFPYPVYAKIKDRSYSSTHVLFPFYNSVEGERNSGWRILPFYGHYERKGIKQNPIYERTFVMWPFLTWSTSGMNEEAPTETFFFFPFYGRIKGNKQGAITIMWPFFKYSVSESKKGKSWEVRAPFPFLLIANGPDHYKFDLWPLFGIKERPGYLRHFLFWPIWRHEDLKTRAGRRFSGQWFLPLFWQTRWTQTDGSYEHKWRAFPFMHYRRYRDGSMDVGGLTPWWFDDAGWARTLGHFFTLYRYQRDRKGGSQHDVLLGLASTRSRPAERDRAEYSRLSLLFGLVQWRSLGKETGLRFLWLLPEITWGGAS
jgi:hypothetical protein